MAPALRRDLPGAPCGGNSLCTVPAQSPDFFDVAARGYILDFWAFGLVLLLSVLLCWGIKETKMFNNGVLR